MNFMFYLLLAFTVVLAATASAGEPVLDSDGDIIFDGSYYVLPAISGVGGGLTLEPLYPNECPFFVGPEPTEGSKGMPVKFSNWKSKVGFVPESENLNIKMDAEPTICGQSTYWWAGSGDINFDFLHIGVGSEPEAGEGSTNALFQIKKTEDVGVYKIGFCPVGNNCHDVEVFKEEYYGALTLVAKFKDAKPFPVRFVKAPKAETSSKTMPIM